MITKVDNPKTAESKDYTNKGSSSRLLNYLTGNEEKIDKDDLFFNTTEENISKKEMLILLDNNVKGLRDNDHKFFSLSINPAQDELSAIGNDKIKFKDFVKESMVNYAKAFKDAGINENELIWGAIIHEKRFYTELDEYKYKKKNGIESIIPFKAGTPKPGFQMHAHILVSARDRKMEKNLTVLTATNKISRKFIMKEWQMYNAKSFQQLFKYRPNENLYNNQQKQYFEKMISGLEKLGLSELDKKDILKVGTSMNYNKEFAVNFKDLLRDVRNNQIIYDLDRYLKNGKEDYNFVEHGIPQNGVGASASQLDEILNILKEGNQPGRTLNDKEEFKRKRKRKL